jgi:hypothetical protein
MPTTALNKNSSIPSGDIFCSLNKNSLIPSKAEERIC